MINREQLSATQQIAEQATESQEFIGGLTNIFRSPEAQRFIEHINLLPPSNTSSPPVNRRLNFNTCLPSVAPVFREPLDYDIDANVPAECVMDRSITTVVMAYKEYHEGIAGKPPLRRVEEVHGSKWRNKGKDRQWWSNRCHIWKEIAERAVREDREYIDVCIDMDNERLQHPDGRPRKPIVTLAKLVEFLKKGGDGGAGDEGGREMDERY